MRYPWFVVAALLVAAGCSGGDEPADGGDGGAIGGSGGSAGSGGTDGNGGTGGTGGAVVNPATDGPDSGWEPAVPQALDGELPGATRPADCGDDHGFVSAVRGWAVAPGGEPLVQAKAQLCIHTSTRQFVCLTPSDTDAEGVYTVDVPEPYRCMDKAAMRVLLPRAGRATAYCQMDVASGPASRLYTPSVLPLATPAVDLPPEGDPDTKRPVTFDDGLVLQVTPSLYYSGSGSYDRLAGRHVPPDAVGLCGEASTFDGLYAFYPEGEIEAPGFDVAIPNRTGLAAGTAVDLFVLGGLECSLFDGTAVPEATWAKFGEGTVSADGSTIESTPGSGLPCFTWLAYRAKE